MESSKDSEDCVRFCVDDVVLDKNNGGRLVSTAHVVFDYRPTGSGLLCGEVKNAGRIAPDNESHPGVAQIADSIDQDEGCARRFRRIRPDLGSRSVPLFFSSVELHVDLAPGVGSVLC